MKNNGRLLAIILIFVLIVFYGIGLGWGLPSEFSPGVDVDFPIGPLAFVGQYSDPVSTSTYPAFHYILTLPFYAIVIVVSKITNNLGPISSSWPYGFHNPILWFSFMLLVSRALSLTMGIGLLFASWNIKPISVKGVESILGATLLALSGPFTYYVREANLDIPYSFWWTLALVFAWRTFFSDSSIKSLILSGIFESSSFITLTVFGIFTSSSTKYSKILSNFNGTSMFI